VTKVVRAPDIQAKAQEVRARLLADDWAESLNFVVRTELNGAMAYRLARAFGVVPSLSKKAALVKPQDDWQSADPQTLRRAKVLGQIAMERGSFRPPEADELEAQVQKTELQSERKSQLFDQRD
jgi:hypothetical protein